MSIQKCDTDQIKFGERLKAVRKFRKLTLQELADITKISYSYIGRIERGEREPEALVRDTLESWMSSENPDTASFNIIVKEKPEEYISMPVYTLAGAGDPCCLDQCSPIGTITVHKDLDGPNIRVIEIRGRSMETTLMNGARVGVDIEDKSIVSGELYACYIQHEGIVVKRIFLNPDLIIIKSDNPQFADHTVMIDRIDWNTFIQGRVKWVLQKYQS